MERFYRIEIGIAAAIGVACTLLGGASQVGAVPVPSELLVWPVLGMCLAFLVTNGLLSLLSRPAGLGFPWPRAQAFAAVIGVAMFVAMAVWGAVSWPAAPLREQGAEYVDKRGRSHSATSYLRYRRWKTAALWLAMPFNLVIFTSLPAARRRGERRGEQR